jgi:hypothetical protein
MKNTIVKLAGKFSEVCVKNYSKGVVFASRNQNAIMFAAGLGLVLAGAGDLAVAQIEGADGIGQDFNTDNIKAINSALVDNLIAGPLGALLMIIAGIGAIFAAVLGAYRMALACLVVAVGCFILKSIVTLFFTTDAFNE